MTVADALGMIAGQGAGQLAASAPSATGQAVLWISAALVIIGAAYLVAYLRLPSRRMPLPALPPAAPCPCCTGPGWSDDCTCEEDCGEAWCQAADPDGTQPHPAPRPECPWCDTRECIDRDLCNCAGPCGSWLCVVKEADRG